MYATLALAAVGAYLLGSIPFGLLIAKAHGKDLRSIGSGNIGATNVSRALGRKWAYVCFFLDVLKGMLPTLAAMFLAEPQATYTYAERIVTLWLCLAVGCAAVAGHIFPLYVRFKGGKGVATSFGVALGIWPYYTICAAFAIATWFVVVLLWRYVSLASIVASATFPITLVLAIILTKNWRFADLWPLLAVAIAIPLMVTIRHRQNIRRLIEGTEAKIREKK
ncbi:MAG: glycerol-3-phosphate 1-O-acyltransferase PlsY [Planctomycetes bacterium]|nr:glycerol-3-phosphate 1-O-acyltransferase PlsY [Planctomycetota bacterium]MBL7152716.1 glycerol-3-phosphate 1-O-acyltransferase PlsY [Phycisphaerae bacterium]